MSIVLLEALRTEELELLAQAKKLNDRRRTVFKAWFKRNLWRRFTTHTRGMEPEPWLSDWLYTKKLDDTYRGSPKDTNTSKKKGDHEYYPQTRLKWSNVIVQVGLKIVLDSRDLLVLFVDGNVISVKLFTQWIELAAAEAVNELIDKHQPNSPTHVVANVRLPDALLANVPLRVLEHSDLTIGFVPTTK